MSDLDEFFMNSKRPKINLVDETTTSSIQVDGHYCILKFNRRFYGSSDGYPDGYPSCCHAVSLIWWTWNVAPYAFSVSMLVLKCLIISARYKTDKGRSFSFIMPILIDFKSFKMFQNPAFPHTQNYNSFIVYDKCGPAIK